MDKYKAWVSKEEAILQKEWWANFETNFWWGNSKKIEPKPDDNIKLAWVIMDGKRDMIGVDNKTMEGFELKDDIPMWKIPLVPLKYDSFERWCTTFDV